MCQGSCRFDSKHLMFSMNASVPTICFEEGSKTPTVVSSKKTRASIGVSKIGVQLMNRTSCGGSNMSSSKRIITRRSSRGAWIQATRSSTHLLDPVNEKRLRTVRKVCNCLRRHRVVTGTGIGSKVLRGSSMRKGK